MEGYKIEELYYLYRQGCPIAKQNLIEYCYWQVKMALSVYYYSLLISYEDYEDYIQMIVTHCLVALERYRPDRGMQVRSFVSMIIEHAVATAITKTHNRILKEQRVVYSLDEYFDEKSELKYIDIAGNNDSPDRILWQKESHEKLEEYIQSVCTELEQAIIEAHKLGLKEPDIALLLDKDTKCIYNANYRIQKKMEKSNLFD